MRVLTDLKIIRRYESADRFKKQENMRVLTDLKKNKRIREC